jgi:hypothetical protein
MGPVFRGHNGRKSAVDRGVAEYYAFALERGEISVAKRRNSAGSSSIWQPKRLPYNLSPNV